VPARSLQISVDKLCDQILPAFELIRIDEIVRQNLDCHPATQRSIASSAPEYNLFKSQIVEDVMGLLDGVLGGLVGAGINEMIQRNGGVQGLVSQFEKKGLGGIAHSWVGTGSNQPVSADQLVHVLGSDNVAQFAAKLNVSSEELLNKLSELLPEHVDKMTSGGVISKG
jgi:uncharacterized protein YidB (DUF937 family)